MFDFVHARIAWITAVLLVWIGHGALQDDAAAKAIKKAERVEVRDAHVALRPADAVRPRLRDPFVLPAAVAEEAAAPGRALGLVERGAALLACVERHVDPLTRLLEAALPALAAVGALRRDLAVLATLPEAPAVSGPPPAFRLELQAVSRRAGTSSARINGRLFHEGDVIPGVDAAHPPRVQAIEGVTVWVMHRGGVLRLDLDAQPSVQVGEPPSSSGAGAGPAPRASSAPSAGPALSPRERNRLLIKGGR